MAMVSGSGMFCLPASVTKPARSECALKRPSMPASAQRSLTLGAPLAPAGFSQKGLMTHSPAQE